MESYGQTSAASHRQWQACARCGGRFPGPGVEQHEHIYCCDKCARGPKGMMLRRLPMAALLVVGGAALGAFACWQRGNGP